MVHYLIYQGYGIPLDIAVLNVGFPFLQGGFLYLYIRSKLDRLRPLDFLPHMVPFALALIYVYWKVWMVQHSDEGGRHHFSFYKDAVLSVSLLVVLGGYILLSYKRIQQMQAQKNNTVLWAYILLAFVGAIWMNTLLAYVRPDWLLHGLQVKLQSILFVVLTGMVYFMGYFKYREKEITTDIPRLSVPKYTKDRMSEEESDALWVKLEGHMKMEKAYLDPECNLNSLAIHLATTTHKLSQLINRRTGDSFNDYLNRFRLEHVKALMLDPRYAHFSLLGLAFESGFASKATFNRVFKKWEDCTPSEYRDRIITENK